MSDTAGNSNMQSNLMSKFQKLRSEVNVIHSIFSKENAVDVNSTDESTLLKRFCEMMINRQNLQDEFNEVLLENQNENSMKILEHIQLMKDEVEIIKNHNKTEFQSIKKLILQPESDDFSMISSNSNEEDTPASVIGKEFVLKHVFEIASEIGSTRVYSEEEEHFNIPWKIYIYRNKSWLALFLNCPKSLKTGSWSVQTNFEHTIVSNQGMRKIREGSNVFGNKNGNEKFSSNGWPKFIDWESLEKDYIVDGKLRVEIRVKITKTTGLYAKPLRHFDERNKELSDVVIVVKETKFHVFKLLLAAQSSFFKALFVEQSDKTELELAHIEPDDFQVYLEVLYGEPAIDENTVEVVLYVARMYVTDGVMKKCEQFLIDKSEKKMKKKLQLAIKYKLEKLRRHLFDNINTAAEIRSVVSSDINDMDPLTMASLFQKSLDILG